MARLASPPKDIRTESQVSPTEGPPIADLERQRRLARERAKMKAASRTAAKRQQAAERIAAAAEELSSGVAQANAAADQLNKAMEQISSGATEASAACQENQA
ncbi:MAG TPA: hypothetical protein ENG51_12890, partial [Deltaproteobacteria bacterium]|nr:hypothetical protein [Deltaproteobacteria bacterium]